jgi:hypothetical protein
MKEKPGGKESCRDEQHGLTAVTEQIQRGLVRGQMLRRCRAWDVILSINLLAKLRE